MILKQWELPKGAKIEIRGQVLKFIKMDGMYGKWSLRNLVTGDSEIVTGNFDGFEKVSENLYKVINN